MKKKCIIISFIILIGSFLLFLNHSLAAGSNINPTPAYNMTNSRIKYSSLTSIDSGYMRVFYNDAKKNIGIEYYDSNFKIQSKKNIAMELNYYGGFYAGNNAYYLIEGQANEEEKADREVIRVIKYDTNWKRLGAAKITGDPSKVYRHIRYPFDVGCVEMTEVDGKLYIVTGHTGYIDTTIGQGHQGFLMLEVDETKLEGRIIDADLWHSFFQYIDYKDSNFYVAEQSEGSRYAKITRYSKINFKETAIPVLEYGGGRDSVWALPCYANVWGVGTSKTNVLSLGDSIDQSKYDQIRDLSNEGIRLARNIYITVTPINDFSKDKTQVKWITDYKDSSESKTINLAYLTKINDNKFMISWSENNDTQEIEGTDLLSINKLHYVFIDGNGNKLSKEYTAHACISNCKPIVKGNKVVFYASSGNMVDFYSIDASNGKFSKVTYQVAGENATWYLDKNGKLTITGSGAIEKFDNNSGLWKPIRENINEIVINEGITSIADTYFQSMPNLTEVILPNSMKSVGKQAFAYSSNLRKIVMLSNINSIGEDAVWSGYYSYDYSTKRNYATIYTLKGSFAEKWAKDNNVSCKYIEKLTLTNSSKDVTLKVLGENTTKLSVKNISSSDENYTELKSKVSDKYILASYNVVMTDGICFGENELTFKINSALKGKNVIIVHKEADESLEVINKKVDSNGNITIKCDDLGNFMIAINKSDMVFPLGDVNKDFKVNIQDAIMILKHITGKIKFNNDEMKIADTTRDGRVNIQDAVQILKLITGKIKSL